MSNLSVVKNSPTRHTYPSAWAEPAIQQDILGIVHDIWLLRPIPFLDLATHLQNKFWNKFEPGELITALQDYHAELERNNGSR